MAYKAIVDFKDLQTGIDYKAGDVYPKYGTVDSGRISQLMTPTTQRGALIEETVEKTEKVEKKSKKAEKKEE